jgi:serine/threonine protein phosphatase 1
MKKNRTFYVADLHGGFRALVQVLKAVGFDYENDTLIQGGDIVDGWSEPFECLEELLKIKNLIAIRGNHDAVFQEYLDTGKHQFDWLHGSYTTLQSYAKHADREIMIMPDEGAFKTNLTFLDVPSTHVEFYRNQVNYYIKDNNVFVHGGFDRHLPLEEQREDFIYYWDRNLFKEAFADSRSTRKNISMKFKEDWIEKIFIGHSPTLNYYTDYPMLLDKIINMDTGGGYGNGRVSIINVDTMEITQSDLMKYLYPEEGGR